MYCNLRGGSSIAYNIALTKWIFNRIKWAKESLHHIILELRADYNVTINSCGNHILLHKLHYYSKIYQKTTLIYSNMPSLHISAWHTAFHYGLEKMAQSSWCNFLNRCYNLLCNMFSVASLHLAYISFINYHAEKSRRKIWWVRGRNSCRVLTNPSAKEMLRFR